MRNKNDLLSILNVHLHILKHYLPCAFSGTNQNQSRAKYSDKTNFNFLPITMCISLCYFVLLIIRLLYFRLRSRPSEI